MSGRVQLPVRRLADGETARLRDGGSERLKTPGHTPPPGTQSRSPAVPQSADAGPDAEAALWSALGEVLDPEFPISIVDLGLVYGVRRAGATVEVDLTFTATGCPCMDFIREDVRERLLREPGVAEVRIRVVWDPPWTRERITAAGRATLRRHGVAA